MSYSTVNFAFLQLGWLACVLSAARGTPGWGVAFVAGALAVHVGVSREPRRECLLLGAAALVGPFLDVGLAKAGALAYAHWDSGRWIAPPWIIALWALFASTMRHCLSWLSRRYALAAALGALGGPLGYLAAARLGALTVGGNWAFSVGLMAAGWAAATAGLVRAAEL